MTKTKADTSMTATAAPSTRTLASSILNLPDGEENDENYNVGLKQLESFLWLNASRLNNWVEEQKATIDANAEQHRQAAMREQSHLDKLHHDLLSIRLDQSLCLENENDDGEEEVGDDDDADNATTTTKKANRTELRLVKEQEQVEADLERVHEVTNHKKVEIQELEKRIAERREQVGHEHQWLASIQHSKTIAHAELARVVDKYRALGLVFDPAAPTTRDDDDDGVSTSSSALRFAFTLLDANDPDRRFEFTLATTNDDDKLGGEGVGDDEGGSYELLDCDPILSPRHAELEKLVQELNDTDDMAPFIGRMRQLFVEEIAKEHVHGTVG